MLNIVYSNRYEVLRQCLIENLRLDYSNTTIDPLFSPLQVIVPSDAVSDDLMRTFVNHPDAKGVCMGLKMEWISSWMRPYGSLWLGKGEIGKTLEWIIWDILDKAELDLAVSGRLVHFLKTAENRPTQVYELAIRIAAVFTKYINYRFDWVLEWLGEKTVESVPSTERLKVQRMLRDRHPDAGWQKALWEKVKVRLDGLVSGKLDTAQSQEEAKGHSLIDLVRKIPDSLEKSAVLFSDDRRALHFFMPQVLPPLALPFLAKEAGQRDVWLYLMNPCQEYWFGADGRWFGSRSEEGVSGNAFLHRNAASTRALIDRIWRFAPEEASQSIPLLEEAVTAKQLSVHKKAHLIPWNDLTETKVSSVCNLDQAEMPSVNSHLICVERKGKTLLDRMADSLLADEPLKVEGFRAEDDRSFRILKASGFVRQVEAVVDWIQACRRDDPTLKPEDVLVVTPQIDERAPLIRGVMASQPEDQQLAYRIVGRTELAVNTAASAILKTGRMVHSMLSAAAFSEMLALPLLTVSWAVSLDDVQVMQRWLETAGFRFGIDGEHLRLLAGQGLVEGETETSDGTLERAMERLVMGRLTEEGHYQPYGDVLPVYGTENSGFDRVSDAEGLVRLDVLTNIYMALKGLYARTFENLTPDGWNQWTVDLLETLFPVGIEQKAVLEDIGTFRKTLSMETEILSATLGQRGMPFEVFWMALEKGFVETRGRQHADGCIVFAGMQDFRGLPFKAIAMIGMDDGPVFPGVNRAEEFDLTQPQDGMDEVQKGLIRRKGDRDSREDNRNVFLDLLLAAQDRLLIAYDAGPEPTVASKALNPSIVVQDLMFWLQESGVDLGQVVSVLPLTRYSAGNLWRIGDDGKPEKTDARYFRTCDERVLRSVEAVESGYGETGDRKLGAEPAFIDSDSRPLEIVSPVTSSGIVTIPFPQLVEVWNSPDTVVRKAIGMAEVGWSDTDRTPQVQMPEDRLFQSMLERRILACLRKEESVDFLADDPRIGCQSIREGLLAPVKERMMAVNALIQMLMPDGFEKQVPPVQLEVDGITVQIPVPEVEQCLGGSYGGAGYLQVVSGTRGRTSAWLLHLLLSASEKPLSMYLVNWTKDGPELKRLAVLPAVEVKQVLVAICQLFMRVMKDKTVFPNHYSNGFGGMERPRFNPFWRHDEAWQDMKNQQKATVDKTLEAFLSIETVQLDGMKKKRKSSKVPPTASELCSQIRILMETEPMEGEKHA
ncbi:MAG: exodeoxyribonuclease V subunit gamma [Oxalobacter sp.]|nr:exodeoxyribonuclease V subunit gamma [Oxalobacter sp.]